MITISKPKLVAVLALIVLLLPTTLTFVHAFTFTRELPSNTIYFDDFATSNGWVNETSGTTTGIKAQLNTSLSFDTPTSFGFYEPNANSHIGIMKNIALPIGVTRVGMSVWVSNNYAMYLGTAGNAGELHMWYWSFSAPNNIQYRHAMVEYRPGRGQFMAFTPNDGAPAQYYRFAGADGARAGYFAYNDAVRPATAQNAWYWESFVIDLTSSTYVSYCASVGCFANVTGAPFGNTAGNGLAPTTSVLGIGLRLTVDTIAVNANILFDDLLITDETPGHPNILQFGIVTASGLFQLILITTAMMYVSSGFGSVMRVFAKEKTPKFLGPKFIIVTGVVGTAGFLFMLIVGANLVAPACPPGAICTG
jgi:hypothetical protein